MPLKQDGIRKNEKEVWKDILEFKGIYQASNCGKVRSLDRTVIYKSGKIIKRKGVELKPSTTQTGYYMLCLCVKNKHLHRTVHRLIAKTFIPNPENKPQVNHKDGNKRNNKVSNLEWATIRENNIHGTFLISHNPPKGERNGFSKLKEKEVVEIIKMLKRRINPRIVAEKYKVTASTIYLIKNNKKWKHLPRN